MALISTPLKILGRDASAATSKELLDDSCGEQHPERLSVPKVRKVEYVFVGLRQRLQRLPKLQDTIHVQPPGEVHCCCRHELLRGTHYRYANNRFVTRFQRD
ncbi:hypothetical protein BLN97_05210 [Bradyrhizobium elkanii]|nr:hypothetical protein BLN97_05210 [Bradyrhizobium elkanii]